MIQKQRYFCLVQERAMTIEKIRLGFLILTEKKATRELKNKISDSLFEAELDTEQVITCIVHNVNNWDKYSKTPIFMNIAKDGIEL